MKLLRLLPLALAAVATWAQPPLIVDASAQLGNVSVRHSIPAGGTLIAGFVISQSSGSMVLARAVGPSLASLGVAGTMPNPRLQIVDSRGRVVAENDDWIHGPAHPQVSLAHATQMVGAFPLSSNASNDAAVVAELPAGAYSLVISGSSATDAGVVIGEMYRLPHVTQGMIERVVPNEPLSRLLNLSVRCRVTPESPTIAGFVIQGIVGRDINTGALVLPKRRFLVRVVGSTLSSFGVADALADAYLTITDSRGIVFKFNDNWDTDAAEAAAIRSAAASVGAFPLASGSRDAAAIVELESGSFTVQAKNFLSLTTATTIVPGTPGTNPPPAQPADAIPAPGTVLIEIYEL